MFKVKLNNALWLLSTVATVLLLDNGAVVDFIYIDFGVVSTGIFNIAGIAIITGVIMLLAHQLNKNRPDN